jgi:heme/copper-type cytochrome/quinol oxidase subunit 2
MANRSGGTGVGIGVFTFFTLLILKSTGVIGMHWFWVLTSFIWSYIVVALFILIVFSVPFIISERKRNKRLAKWKGNKKNKIKDL